MSNSDPPFAIRFTDIALNPFFKQFYKMFASELPQAAWWIFDETLTRKPFPSARTGPFCETASCDLTLQENHRSVAMDLILQAPETCKVCFGSCCADRLQGIVLFRYRKQVYGGIGICGFDASQKPRIQQIFQLLEGYLTLLSGALEDHDDLEMVHTLWTETIAMVQLEELLQRAMNELRRILDVSAGLILLVNEDGELVPAHGYGFPQALLKSRTLNVTRYEYLSWIESDSASIREMALADPLRRWFITELHNLLPDQYSLDSSCVSVPFLRLDYMIGVFLTVSPASGPYSKAKQDLVRLLVYGIAAALDNAMTMERMNQRRRALATIHVVHRLISSSISTQDLLPRIGQLTRQLLKTKKCSIMWCDPENQVLVPRVRIGLEAEEVGQKTLAYGEGLPGWVAENYNPILYYPQCGIQPPWKTAGELYPSESYLAVALMDSDINGVIMVAEKEDDFTPGDREILMTFAEQVVLAIKNAQLLEGERTLTINTLKSFANLIETQDPRKTGVTVNTCEWALKMGQILYLSDKELQNLTYAALLHDTGMLRALRTEISMDEQRLKGPQISLRFVESMGLSPEVGSIVYHVNEAWNGQGFPDGLKGNDIPLGSRIIAAANAFAAVLSRRQNLEMNEHLRREKAYRIVARMAKRAFDPDVVNALEQAIRNPISPDENE